MNLGLLLTSAWLLSGATARVSIVTNLSGAPPEHVTTGNAISPHLYWETLHSGSTIFSEEGARSGYEDFLRLKHLRDLMILDFANEDPRTFTPHDDKYFYVVSKRGQVFHLLATLAIGVVFWIFYMRVANGDCGGYKTIVRKPTKDARYSLHAIVAGGFVVFMAGFVYVNVHMIYDRDISRLAGNAMVQHNSDQLELFESAMAKISEINTNDVDVIYSEQSYERFHVGNYGRFASKQLRRSLRKASEFNETIFRGTKNSIYLSALVLLLGVCFLLFGFFYAYKNRKVLVALFLSAGMSMLLVFGIIAFASLFNYFSVFVDVCDQTYKVFDVSLGHVENRLNNRFTQHLTILSPNKKQMLKTQINTVLLAQNTVLTILRNYFDSAVHQSKFDRKLDSIGLLLANRNELEAKIAETAASKPELRDNLIKFLDYAEELNSVYKKLAALDSAVHLKQWAKQMNQEVCTNGLHNQWKVIWGFVVMLLGLMILNMGIYFSENIIRGIYNEEIMYVKTNKLRYDWN